MQEDDVGDFVGATPAPSPAPATAAPAPNVGGRNLFVDNGTFMQPILVDGDGDNADDDVGADVNGGVNDGDRGRGREDSDPITMDVDDNGEDLLRRGSDAAAEAHVAGIQALVPRGDQDHHPPVVCAACPPGGRCGGGGGGGVCEAGGVEATVAAMRAFPPLMKNGGELLQNLLSVVSSRNALSQNGYGASPC